jgi:hypothetical protein
LSSSLSFLRLNPPASRLREYSDTKRGNYRREIPLSEKIIEVDMGTGRRTKIRIIKHGTASNLPESQAAPVPAEKPMKDPKAELFSSVSGWVAEFEQRRRPDPRITFQALFKEV